MDVIDKPNDEWYTPPEVFKTMDLDFDIDVCAPTGGIEWIPCKQYYTKADNSLVQPWTGRVWMNPPYSGPSPFVDKFISHGNGIALLPMSKSKWFSKLWSNPSVSMVVPDNQSIKFVKGGVRKQISFPLIFVAIGDKSNHVAIEKLGYARR